MFSIKRLNDKTRAQILHMLVEGNSLRATVRMAGASRNTVDKLLRDVGNACLDYQDRALRDLPCKHIECDEIWSFVYAKQRNVPDDLKGIFGVGDVWTWTAICSDTKLVSCWHVGPRNLQAASLFMDDLAGRLAHRVQLTTDGHKPYLEAVERAFGAGIDYSQLIKIYGQSPEGQRRYSSPEVIEVREEHVCGTPRRKAYTS